MSILELCVHEECNEQEASGFKVFCCLEAVARSTRVREEYTGEIPGYLPTGAPSILFRGKHEVPTVPSPTENSSAVCPRPDLTSNEEEPWPSDLLGAIRRVIEEPCRKPSEPELRFDMTEEAAERNCCILGKYGKELGQSLEAQR